jgi:hypothetical protein
MSGKSRRAAGLPFSVARVQVKKKPSNEARLYQFRPGALERPPVAFQRGTPMTETMDHREEVIRKVID